MQEEHYCEHWWKICFDSHLWGILWPSKYSIQNFNWEMLNYRLAYNLYNVHLDDTFHKRNVWILLQTNLSQLFCELRKSCGTSHFFCLVGCFWLHPIMTLKWLITHQLGWYFGPGSTCYFTWVDSISLESTFLCPYMWSKYFAYAFLPICLFSLHLRLVITFSYKQMKTSIDTLGVFWVCLPWWLMKLVTGYLFSAHIFSAHTFLPQGMYFLDFQAFLWKTTDGSFCCKQNSANEFAR